MLSAVKPFRETARHGNALQQPQSDPENGLIELIGILSHLHTVATVFNPLFRVRDGNSENVTRWKACDYIPFSSTNELAEMTSKLRKNLDTWQVAYFRTATIEVNILWHLCFVYLALPSLQLLIELSGYSCRATTSNFDNENAQFDIKSSIAVISADLKSGKEAVEHAWKILQLCSDCKSTLATSVWRPLALFVAALTVWANLSIEKDTSAFASLKILQLFETEVTKLEFSGGNEMSTVLKRLQGMALGYKI